MTANLYDSTRRMTDARDFGQPTANVPIPVPPGSGGTGTGALTPGRIPYIGALGVFSQDAGLLWDTVGGMTVGRMSGAGKILIQDTDATVHALGLSGAPLLQLYNNSVTNNIGQMAEIQLVPENVTGAPAGIAAVVDTAAAIANGIALVFGTTPAGGPWEREAMRLTSAGRLGVNTAAPATTLHVNGKSTLGTGTFAIEGMFNSAIRSTSNGIEAVLGASGAGDATGASVAIFEKYSSADICNVSNATVSIIAKKIGGTGAPSGGIAARISGIQSDSIDLVGWNPASGGPEAFTEGGHFRGTGAWTGAKQGSVQGLVADAQIQAPATDFGFLNALECSVYNYVLDKGFRSVSSLNSFPADMSVVGIFQSVGTQPIDIGISIGNGYGDQPMYHGLYIRKNSIATGGNLISSDLFTVTKAGYIAMGTSLPTVPFHHQYNTATTNAVVPLTYTILTTSGAAAAGLGAGNSVWIEDSAGSAQQAFAENTFWVSATAGAVTGQRDYYAVDSGGGRLCLSLAASGTAPLVGFYGTAPVAKPNVAGAKGGNAALTNLLTALANLGLLTDSTT